MKFFVNDVLGPNDDITRFEFIKKNERETGPALVGIELKTANDYEILISKMIKNNINYTELNSDRNLFEFLV